MGPSAAQAPDLPNESGRPTPERREAPRRHEPAVPLAFAVAGGVLVDRGWDVPLVAWGWLAVVLLIAAFGLRRTRWGAALAVLGVWACVGGVRHHGDWSLRRSDNVLAFATVEATPARLTGRVVSGIVIDEAEHDHATPLWMQVDRSRCVLECAGIGPETAEASCSGRVRVEVSGHLLGPRVGDRLEIFGALQRPGPPVNPGGFDYAEFLRAQQVDAVLRVEHPDHVRVIGSAPTIVDRLRNLRDSLRRECEELLRTHLAPQSVPLAASLLLGDRTGLEHATETAFAESGTMHLLAISGLNVALLAGFLHLACRLLKTPGATTMVVLLIGVLGYAALTDQRPPVLRAALLAMIVLAGTPLGRSASGYHRLALCAVVLLLYRPSDLFDAGAQLSFLAVLAIVWSSRLVGIADAVPGDFVEERPAWQSGLTMLGGWLWRSYVVTGSIWLFTLPLTAYHFHLIAPVGLLINVVLIPLVAVMLAAGYLMLLIGLALPAAAIIPALLFEPLLRVMLWLIEGSASLSLGHVATPAPPLWWMVGFYLLLAAACGLLPLEINSRIVWRGTAVWTALGLAVGLFPSRPDGVRCTFLSVGHGCAVLLELPDGRRLLYDAGSFADGRRAQRTIQSALWESGGRGIDAIIVSHADVDHFNGAAGLVRSLPVGTVLFPGPFLDFRQEAVPDVCETAAEQGVPLRLLQAGDTLVCGDDVSVEVLHPAGGFRDEDDNANSAVLRIKYAGRSILLTGDLEGDGLGELLALPSQPVDVLMSPHHGSLAANPAALGEWGSPRYVVVSTGDRGREQVLAGCYPAGSRVLSTADRGAVTITIDPDGKLRIETYVADPA
jgi:competence protein ComEC